jgi:hypothetical protein
MRRKVAPEDECRVRQRWARKNIYGRAVSEGKCWQYWVRVRGHGVELLGRKNAESHVKRMMGGGQCGTRQGYR